MINRSIRKGLAGLVTASALAVASQANGTLYTYNSTVNTSIPDGNLTGIANTINVSGLNANINDINVNLNISGGYNGDLYGYLVHSDGNGNPAGFAILLNREGKTSSNPFGYSDSGFHVTLDDQANDIHNYQNLSHSFDQNGALTGTWSSDGRNVDPNLVYGSDARNATLDSFNGFSGNGTWTLFLADMSGGSTSYLQDWSIDINVVPEPTSIALGIFGLAGLGKIAHGRLKKKNKIIK